ITAVADYFPQTAQAAGERLKVAEGRRFSGLSGYRRLLAAKVDAVFLETPPCFFPEHAAAAVEAGCHVYVAKPVAVDVPGCLTIARLGKAAMKARKVFLVDFQTRTDPFFIEAIKRIHAGALDRIGLISSIYTDNGFADPPLTKTIESRLRRLIWVNDITLGGGNLVAAGVHAADVALWVAGRLPSSAMGSSRAARADPHGDTHDVYSLTYQFEDGPIWNHRGEHVNNVHGFVCRCMAFGRGAYFEGNYEGKTYLRGSKMAYRGGEVADLYGSGISANLDIFHKSITEGVYDNPTVAPSVNSTLACILGRDAAHRNALLTWDDMMKANRKIDLDLTGLKQ
ncbi:MAG: Gfo/Idh/MocA family oxidoreductase, partial [Phycisphaerae bacterium]